MFGQPPEIAAAIIVLGGISMFWLGWLLAYLTARYAAYLNRKLSSGAAAFFLLSFPYPLLAWLSLYLTLRLVAP